MEPDLPPKKEKQDADKKQASNHKNNPYWKTVRIAALVGIVEGLSLVLWVKSEDFSPEYARHIRWLATCGFLYGVAFLAHKLTGGRFKKKIICGIWGMWAIVCFILLQMIPEEPKADLLISLRIGEPHGFRLFLTNDFLSERHLLDKGKLSDGGELVQSFVPGCLIIPVKTGESNKVFRLNVENDSPFKLTEVEVCIGFPLGLNCRFDPEKLESADASIIFARRDKGIKLSKWTPTNVQYFMTKHPRVMLPFDSADVPAITNPCVNEHFRDGSVTCLMDVIVKCAEHEEILAVNVMFAPAASNFSKPYITHGTREPDGSLQLLTTPAEFEASQK
jgi:hypothetical protein